MSEGGKGRKIRKQKKPLYVRTSAFSSVHFVKLTNLQLEPSVKAGELSQTLCNKGTFLRGGGAVTAKKQPVYRYRLIYSLITQSSPYFPQTMDSLWAP